ncbi:hypothetical protein OIDMADRAFT_105451 [Oidiodendron maius Zn]|uniref:Ubiquitin-like domain-containing protein n=1 Tax=Oidiodendron maius (strain Zn) TaxID=913774 RepID=A0A0C3H6A8_OIDMZ|nr:hypothetical protein OIDMADRAFT_105451 [Oidiodendron maius Zn]
MSDEAGTGEADPQITFKVKTSSEGLHTITIAESVTVADLKNLLAGDEYEKIPAARQRLIYSGRVMKDEDQLSKYKIKSGNTIHMVKSAASNAAQNPASSGAAAAAGAPRAAAGVPTNMAAGTANNPLAGLTGARFAGHMGLPGAEMFGADGGMGAPPSEESVAQMLEDPNTAQIMREALRNPAIVDMMIQNTPHLRNNPQARQIIQSPEFMQMMTNPEAIREAARMRRMMAGFGGGAGGFPAPGVTDTTPAGAAGTNTTPNQPNAPPFNLFPGAARFAGRGAPSAPGANPFAALFGQPGQIPSQSPPAAGTTPAVAPGTTAQGTPGQGTPSANPENPPANPFASLFGGGPNPFGQMPPLTPEQMQEANQAINFLRSSGVDFGSLFGDPAPPASSSPAPPADTRPPEERYADQLRQLNDMGFFDFDRNVEALRRSGGSVQGAIEQLLS